MTNRQYSIRIGLDGKAEINRDFDEIEQKGEGTADSIGRAFDGASTSVGNFSKSAKDSAAVFQTFGKSGGAVTTSADFDKTLQRLKSEQDAIVSAQKQAQMQMSAQSGLNASYGIGQSTSGSAAESARIFQQQFDQMDEIARQKAAQIGQNFQSTLNTVSYLMRGIRFDRIVGLDDYDVETAASLREHLRVPGMGDSQARFFRDKLACRIRLRELGLRVPDHTPVFNNEVVAEWIAKVPPPWMLKPRSEASAAGISKVESAEELWRLLDSKGDERSLFHLEAYLAGDVYHVDSLTNDGKVIFAEAARCGDPPFNVAHGGGIFPTVTLPRGTAEEKTLKAFNEQILTSLKYERGASHVEFIKSKADGHFYLLETSARVGGAHIAEMHELSTNVNLWQEWANLEVDAGVKAHQLPKRKSEYAGLMMTLARQEHPDFSSYNDPEVVFHAPEASHAGLIMQSPDRERIVSLVENYKQRFITDFMTVMPSPRLLRRRKPQSSYTLPRWLT